MRNARNQHQVRSRAKAIAVEHKHCKVIGCPHPPRAATRNGLDTRFCRSHADFYSRHGSPYKGSYSAAQLQPYRKVVRKWLKENRENAWVLNAVTRVRGLYDRAGPHEEAFRLAGMSAQERGRKAWARLRTAGVSPLKVVEGWLVIDQAIMHDPQPVETSEFRRVQAAKLVHRLASGSHKRWEREIRRMVGVANVPIVEVTELHKYPQSRGKVLRVFGADIEEACGLVTEAARRDLQD